jgi:hydroxyethylthiazole kinase
MKQDNVLLLNEIRRKKPLILHITNQVTLSFLANGVLAAGGSPMMVHSEEEVAEAVRFADALVINIGTLEPALARSMITAAKVAASRGIPVVIDPVAVGMTKLRQNKIAEILAVKSKTQNVICGNAAEITYLAYKEWGGRGVDGALDGDLRAIAETTARQTGCLIVMTGKIDVITDGDKTAVLEIGHEMMANVTGTGCLSTSLTALFLASSLSTSLCSVEKAARSMLMLGICAEKAAINSPGSGTFAVHLLDELNQINGEELEARYRQLVKEDVL